MCSPTVPERSMMTMPWLDRMGMATSTLCAIHCIATAVLMGALSAIGAAGLAAGWIEEAFLTAAFGLGLISLGHAVRRHRSWQPALWFVAGMVLLLIVRPRSTTPGQEALLAVAGALCVVRAHWKNARLLLA